MNESAQHATPSAALRRSAEGLARALPPLLASAEQLSTAVQLGEHGRRRAGMGDEFWQYRPAHGGDWLRDIDWRRSARADSHFVREKEWQAAQSVHLWVDDARSMEFTGEKGRVTKSERARLLALSIAVLLVRAGERVGLCDAMTPPRAGSVRLMELAERLSAEGGGADYGRPDARAMLPHARAVFVSDFLGDLPAVEAALAEAADKGVRGLLLQVLDPFEETFPFEGRTIFESMGGALIHETKKAGDLRGRYQARLAERKDRMEQLARATGWLFSTHHTSSPAQGALLWLYQGIEGFGR